jgi:hypothetical protein
MARAAPKGEWTFERLMKSAKKIVNPSGSRGKWRGASRNYTSSAARKHDRTIPFVGTKSVLFQFSHSGLTEDNKIHRIHLQFFGLRVFREDQINTTALEAMVRGKNFFKAKHKGDTFFVEKPSVVTPVRVRCTCSDAFFRWNWYNFDHKAAFGSRPRKYQRKTRDAPPVNPGHEAGVCKHMINSLMAIESDGKIKPGTRSPKSLRV